MEGDSILVADNTYDETGIYVDSLINQFGCDSIITLYLFVQPPDSNCIADAGQDTLICGFTYPLHGFPGGGLWNIICEESPGLVQFEYLNDTTIMASVTDCGSYYFTYTITQIDSLFHH